MAKIENGMTVAVMRCPECGEPQHAVVVEKEEASDGYRPVRLMCKYCLCEFGYFGNFNGQLRLSEAEQRDREDRRRLSQRRYRLRNRDAINRRYREAYSSNPEVRARIKRSQKAYREKNREALNERRRQCRDNESEKLGKIARDRVTLANMREDPSHPKHGTTTGYRVGCRCDRCRSAKSAARREAIRNGRN